MAWTVCYHNPLERLSMIAVKDYSFERGKLMVIKELATRLNVYGMLFIIWHDLMLPSVRVHHIISIIKQTLLSLSRRFHLSHLIPQARVVTNDLVNGTPSFLLIVFFSTFLTMLESLLLVVALLPCPKTVRLTMLASVG